MINEALPWFASMTPGCAAGIAVITHGCFDRQSGVLPKIRSTEIAEMAACQLGCVMAGSTGQIFVGHVFIVFTGIKTVVLGGADGMAGGALAVDINTAGLPVRGLLATVTADARAGAIEIVGGGAAFGIEGG